MDFLVDVNIAVFNHALYLEKTLNSILDQKTNFPFRLLIGDDCSTDGSIEILKEFEKKAPDKIKVIYQERNLGLNAPERNGIILLKNSEAKYIALVDGDDYWTDENKLQKQIDFLENNDQYVICFTRGTIYNDFTKLSNINSEISTGVELDIDDFIEGNNQLTTTVVFKKNADFILPTWFSQQPFGDWSLYLLLLYSSKKKAFCLPDITAVYRIHGSGIHGSMHESNEKLIKAYKMHLAFYKVIKKELFKNRDERSLRAAISKRVSIITQLYSGQNQIFQGVKINIVYLLKGLSWKVFVQNIFSLQKQFIKTLFLNKRNCL
ncbi:MAG TPA: glycosyltransferase [Puia sp.]|jgi:glycosyltransferase involved in cell wall biosynthesis|nr:glycosyltransferase [Puia sp.]